jgi:arylsulfatase
MGTVPISLNGFPAISNVEADPREEVNVVGTSAWVVGPYLKLIGEFTSPSKTRNRSS